MNDEVDGRYLLPCILKRSGTRYHYRAMAMALEQVRSSCTREEKPKHWLCACYCACEYLNWVWINPNLKKGFFFQSQQPQILFNENLELD